MCLRRAPEKYIAGAALDRAVVDGLSHSLYSHMYVVVKGKLMNWKFDFAVYITVWSRMCYLVPAGINTGTWPSRLDEYNKLRQYNMVTSPVGLGSAKHCAGEVQQQLKTTDPIS
jgi:hypothetical protein